MHAFGLVYDSVVPLLRSKVFGRMSRQVGRPALLYNYHGWNEGTLLVGFLEMELG